MLEFTNNVQGKNAKKWVPLKTVHPCVSPMFMVYHTFFFSSCQNWGGKFTIFVPNCDQTLNHLNPKSDPSVFCCLWDAYGDITRLHTCILSSDLSFKRLSHVDSHFWSAKHIFLNVCFKFRCWNHIRRNQIATGIPPGYGSTTGSTNIAQNGWFQIPPWKKHTKYGLAPFLQANMPCVKNRWFNFSQL